MSEREDSQATDPNSSLGQYLTPLRDHSRVVVLVTLVVVAVGMLAAVAGPSSYTARTSVLIYPVSPDPTEALQSTGRSDDMATELRIADSRAVAEMAATELQGLGIGVTPADANASITITNPEDSRVLHVSYQASDPSVARVGSELTASAYLAYRSELNAASRQVARTAIDDEIALLQDRLAAVEGQVDQAAAGSSARLVAEVERTSIEGELAAQQRALADLSTLSIDAATVFDAAQQPTSTDGLGAAQILVGALAGGLVLGMLAAWTLAALGVDPERVPNPRSFTPPTRPGGKTKTKARDEDDDEPSDADNPFDDSDNRDPLELLRALDAVEADPAITLNRASAADGAEQADRADTEASTDSSGDGSAQTLPPLDSSNFEWTPESLADATFGTDTSATDPGDGADQAEAGYDPFDPSTVMDVGDAVDGGGAADPAAPNALLAQLKGETDDPAAAGTEDWPTEDAGSFGPEELFAPIDGLASPADATTDVAADGFTPFETEAAFETDAEYGTEAEFDAQAGFVTEFGSDAEFTGVAEFAAEDGLDAVAEFDQQAPFDPEAPFEFDPEAQFAAEPEFALETDIETDADEDIDQSSLSSGDPRELDPGPPSWDGPFVGPTTWEQLSALAAASAEQPPTASATGGTDADADHTESTGGDDAIESFDGGIADAELVASNDVDGLFDRLSQLGAAGPVAVLSLSDRDPAAGLTAGFELADELRAVGANVLLIDVRLENPVLDTLFEDGPVPGLAQVMTGDVVLAEAVRNLPGLEGLDLLTVGTADGDSAEHLTGAAFQRLLSEARLSYHSIVVIGDAITPAEPEHSLDVDRARALTASVDAVVVGTIDPAGTPASDELVAILGSFDAPTLQLITAPAAAAASEATPEASSV